MSLHNIDKSETFSIPNDVLMISNLRALFMKNPFKKLLN